MTFSDIEFHTPQTLQDVYRLLEELENARLLAGGTDLLVDLKQGLVEIKHLICLQKIKELRGIQKKNGKIRIGSMVTPQEIFSNVLIRQHFPALAFASESMACPQIRSLATIGGNIASAVPSADLPPSLIAGEATAQLGCSGSSREILLAEFFTGPRETVCGGGELLTAVFVSLPRAGTGISYQRFSLREANSLAVAAVAAGITLTKGNIESATIVLGAVGPTPVVAKQASEFLRGQAPADKLFRKAATTAKEESQPISDIRGSIWFRRELVEVLTRRALAEACSRAQENDTVEK